MRYKNEIILFVVTGMLLFSGLDKINVNIMEARNFISAREMVQNKEYLLTTLNNEPRYQKPPLPTWLTAISGSIFGFDSLYALRLPVVVITFLLVFVFYYFSILLGFSSKHSLNNALILITSFYIFFAGRDNQWDMYTHSFMMVCIYFLWKLLRHDSHIMANGLMAGFFLGLSFLSKGPVSFYALLLPFLISYGIVYHSPFPKKKVFSLINMLIAGLAIGLSWFVYVHIKDPEYFRIIALKEASNWKSYEVKPFFYYWNFFIQSGLWTIPSLTSLLLYPYLKNKVEDRKAYQFAILWTLCSVLLLSAVPEKKARYLVPVLIPLALTTGFYIEYLIKNFNKNMIKGEKIWVWFSFGIIALTGFLYPFILVFILKKGIKDYMLLCIFSSIVVYMCSVLIVKGLINKNFNRVFYAIISMFAVLVVAIFPITKKFFYNPEYAPASKAHAIEKEYQIKTYRISDVSPEIIWDFGEPVPLLGQKDGKICPPGEKQFALMADTEDSAIVLNQFTRYKIEKRYRINMCYSHNKNRLIKDYYIVTQKKE